MRSNARILLTSVLALSLSTCRQPAPRVALSAGRTGVAIEDSTTLLVAVPIENHGLDTAAQVKVTSIDLAFTKRTAPATWPIVVGDIVSGHRGVVEASFSAGGLANDQSYSLTITGSFVARGRAIPFSLTQQVTLPPRAPGSATLRPARVAPHSVRGAPFPHRDIVMPAEVNQDVGPPRPTGRRRGTLRPTRPATNIDAGRAVGGGARLRPVDSQINDIVFVRNTAIAVGSGLPNDPSGASGGLNGPEVVLVTGNTYASFSTNGGQSFTTLDPTTIFPERDAAGNLLDGGLCCDQVVHYDGLANRFFWLMQFWSGADGSSRLRLAVASPEALVSSGGTAWSYWDLTSGLVGQAGSMFDYPDLSVGDHFLYASADIGVGLMVFRIPLSELIAGGTINIGYTDPKDGVSAYGKHLIQNPADQIFWAGAIGYDKLRVFSIKESSNQYTWKDVDIDTYPFGNFVSAGPDGSNWLASVFSGGPGGVRLRTATSDEIWFEWMAGSGGGFAQPHIQYVRLNRANLDLIEQSQIWNPDLAINYASFTVVNEKIGVVLAFGGASNYGSPAVGIMGDSVFYAPCTSTANASRYGDYLTVRQALPNGFLFSATVYCVAPGPVFEPHYVLFGRSADVNPVPVGADLRSPPFLALGR